MTNTNQVVITATNAIQNTIEQVFPGANILSTAVREAATVSNEVVFLGFVIGFNWMLKRMPTVYNELIPPLSAVASAIAYPSLMGWSGRTVLIGFGLGLLAVGVHQFITKPKDLIERFRTGNTEFIKNPNPPST